jgi:integrase
MSTRNPSRRSYGTGRLYQKSGAWYGRWRIDGQRVNRKLGPARQPGTRGGLTKAQAEAEMRRQTEAATAARSHERLSVEEVGERLIERAEVKGRKPSTIEALRSALRVHLVPHFGDRPLDRIDVAAVDRFIAAERRAGAAPKSIRNYLGVLHSVFELGVERGWARANPVKRATKPQNAGTREIRFLTLAEVEAVLVAIPADVLGPVEHPLYLTAAMTGLRKGELIALRWQDVDWTAGRLRVRRTYSRGAFGTTKSRRGFRAVPLADRVARELDALSRRPSVRCRRRLTNPAGSPSRRFRSRPSNAEGAEPTTPTVRRLRGLVPATATSPRTCLPRRTGRGDCGRSFPGRG